MKNYYVRCTEYAAESVGEDVVIEWGPFSKKEAWAIKNLMECIERSILDWIKPFGWNVSTEENRLGSGGMGMSFDVDILEEVLEPEPPRAEVLALALYRTSLYKADLLRQRKAA